MIPPCERILLGERQTALGRAQHSATWIPGDRAEVGSLELRKAPLALRGGETLCWQPLRPHHLKAWQRVAVVGLAKRQHASLDVEPPDGLARQLIPQNEAAGDHCGVLGEWAILVANRA